MYTIRKFSYLFATRETVRASPQNPWGLSILRAENSELRLPGPFSLILGFFGGKGNDVKLVYSSNLDTRFL